MESLPESLFQPICVRLCGYVPGDPHHPALVVGEFDRHAGKGGIRGNHRTRSVIGNAGALGGNASGVATQAEYRRATGSKDQGADEYYTEPVRHNVVPFSGRRNTDSRM